MKKTLLALTAVGALAQAAHAAPETYINDVSHTYVNFQISHLGLSTQYARFDKVDAKIVLDKEAKTASVEAKIDVGSLSSGWKKRDDHVKNEDFFNVGKFPSIDFKSTKATFDGDKLTKLDGNLTLLGVTKPVSLTVDAFVCKEHPMAKKMACGANATGALKRTDFGMNAYVPNIGDEVKFTIQIEAFKQ
ncbi:polyisoprenoid-binding protein YceI [Chitinivorax tropicus]|uniref:Polyisoprenoid-binding protein YceI n=1 Tax=Chitinivorax tropicus TaxID=714531 RepID=A0A840MK21_9PROT|nr:YceI family protein [Chitinivorax tropicus]MBB5018998.1 polyisoprenoid-binding protein YceI [Chitinivorax tropicus]